MHRDIANTIIFLMSAAAHEYWISLSLKRLGWLCFFVFNMQYVYIIIENILIKKLKLEKSQLGNFNFWLNFCVLGQPIMSIIYYLDAVGHK